MPRGDGTGPAGMGPMTGRGAGYCAGYPVPGFMNPGGGRGMAWGRGGGGGMGMGWGRGRGGGGWGRGWAADPSAYGAAYAPPVPPAYYGPPSPEQEMDMLRSQADWLKVQMDTISKRLQELEQKEE